MRVYERLSELYFIYFPVRLRLLNTQSFHQPTVLLRCDAACFILAPRPLELAFFQPFVEQEKTVALPIQRFDSVSSPAAKQEQRVCAGIKFELLFNDSRQTVYSATKIGVAAGEVDLRPAEIVQHDFSALNIAVRVASSAPL